MTYFTLSYEQFETLRRDTLAAQAPITWNDARALSGIQTPWTADTIRDDWPIMLDTMVTLRYDYANAMLAESERRKPRDEEDESDEEELF